MTYFEASTLLRKMNTLCVEEVFRILLMSLQFVFLLIFGGLEKKCC